MRKTTFFILIALLWTAFRLQAAPTDSVVSPESAGKYIFVPDSLQNDVIRLLMGGAKVVDDERKLDAGEQTLWKGDTIPMVLKQRNFGRYDRGLSNYLFIPKGAGSSV